MNGAALAGVLAGLGELAGDGESSVEGNRSLGEAPGAGRAWD